MGMRVTNYVSSLGSANSLKEPRMLSKILLHVIGMKLSHVSWLCKRAACTTLICM